MLDFPELFAPARIVSGRMSISHSSAMDLKPFTAILVMPLKVFFRHVDLTPCIILYLISSLSDKSNTYFSYKFSKRCPSFHWLCI